MSERPDQVSNLHLPISNLQPPTSVQALLWDLDGVIVNSGEYHYEAYRELLSGLGHEMSREDYFLRLFGRRNFDILRDVLGDRPQDEIERLARRKEEIFRRRAAGRVRALPGAAELLSDARREGLRQAIVSSTPRQNIAFVLGALGLTGSFEAIVGEEDVSRGKPDPEGFVVAARRLRVGPDGCVVLEDAPDGIAAGKAAGMRCIGVATTRPPERLTQADLVVDSLEDARVREFLFSGRFRTGRSALPSP